jgi:hypothetical protein
MGGRASLSSRRLICSLAADDCQSYAGFVTVAIPKWRVRSGKSRRLHIRGGIPVGRHHITQAAALVNATQRFWFKLATKPKCRQRVLSARKQPRAERPQGHAGVGLAPKAGEAGKNLMRICRPRSVLKSC